MKLQINYSKVLSLTLIFFSGVPAFSQIPDGKNGGAYSAGYREYKTTDSSRRYKPGAAPGTRLYCRPEEIDVWYPSQAVPGDGPLDYFYFLSLFERRANSFQDSTQYNGLAKEMLQHFSIGDDHAAAAPKTKSYLDAKPLAGHFPVILYLSSYNGMSYENVPLFETLAAHGYVVICISSIGRYPGNMTTRYPDALEQARDAEFALHFLAGKGLDTTKIGLAGYSYGGIAAALLAMRHPNIKAMLSLDGSERHYYGRDKGEDKDFDELRNSSYWKPSALTAAYAYLESDHKQDDGTSDSSYRLPGSGKQAYARLTGAEHEDFSGISMLAAKPNAPYPLAERLTLDYFDGDLKANTGVFESDLTAYAASGKIVRTPPVAGPKVGQRILSGTITSTENGDPLPYVSIGIPSGNCGTISDKHGHFSFSVPDTLEGRPVRISSLGYQAQNYTLSELERLSAARQSIRLHPQVSTLKEVTVSAAKSRSKLIGNTSQSKFLNVGFPFRDLGSELGIRVNLGSKKVLLSKFNFNISNTRMDSCTFRLNIYALKDGQPAENLLTQNIVYAIGKQPGAYTIDLLPYRIFLNGTVLVSLEWIGGISASGNGAVFFSAGLLSSSYHRKTTEADWVKFKGLGAAFNLKVLEE